MPRSWLAISLVAALGGCATSAAQHAFDSGDDVGAAKLADDAAEANPRDDASIALRRRARDHAARRELGETAALRAAGHAEAALASFDRLLKQLSDWGGADVLSADLRGPFDAELAAARTFVATIGAREADAGHPLAAEVELARQAPFLAHAELASAAAQAEAHVRDAGASTCARLQTTAAPATPHWTYAVMRYCDHFGVAFTPPAQAPPQLGLDGVVESLDPVESSSLAAHVRGWLESSFWSQAGDVAARRGKVQGKIESSFQHAPVTLHATYRDTITSHAVHGDRSIEEIREERPLGDLFVRQSTASSQVDRSYAYDAEEARGHYALAIDVSLDLGDDKPLTLNLRHTENLKAYDHDVIFEPAGIFPRHDRVPTTAAWIEAQLDRMSTRVVAALNRRFVAIHCTRPRFALDEAARCLVAGQKSRAALDVVGDALGENAEPAVLLLKPAPPPARPAAAKPAHKPADDDNIVID